MEAFGNAKTVRNDNSSRFGKFIEVQFGSDGTIQGARIMDYLLERSRIVHQSPDERNYHIFYCLLAGASKEERAALRLKSPEEFAYLNQSGCTKVPKIDDAADLEKVRAAMKVLKFGDNERSIFEVLAAVLHLGNNKFKKVENANVAGDACDYVDRTGAPAVPGGRGARAPGCGCVVAASSCRRGRIAWVPWGRRRQHGRRAAGRGPEPFCLLPDHAEHDAARRDHHVAAQRGAGASARAGHPPRRVSGAAGEGGRRS